MKIKLSIHGYAQRILVYSRRSILFKRTHSLDEDPLQAALFENDEFTKMQIIYQDKPALNYLQLKEDQVFSVLGYDNFTRIEFKKEGKQTRKVFIKDIHNDRSLFPVFNIVKKTKEINGLIIIEKEMGCFGHSYIISDNFDMHDLQFTISDFRAHDIKGITSIRYKNDPVKFIKGKSLIQSRQAIIVKKP